MQIFVEGLLSIKLACISRRKRPIAGVRARVERPHQSTGQWPGMADSTSSMNVLQSARWSLRRQLSGGLGERLLPVRKRRSLDDAGGHSIIGSTPKAVAEPAKVDGGSSAFADTPVTTSVRRIPVAFLTFTPCQPRMAVSLSADECSRPISAVRADTPSTTASECNRRSCD